MAIPIASTRRSRPSVSRCPMSLEAKSLLQQTSRARKNSGLPENSLISENLEHRSVVELRADRQRIVGYAVVFDVRSRDLGGFVEVVRPQAVDSAVRASTGIVALYNHDSGAVLGRTPQTLQLEKDRRGLAFVLDPAP